MTRAERLAQLLGVGRIAFGAGLVLLPNQFGHVMAGPSGDTPASRIYAGGGGVRDIVLGAGILRAVGTDALPTWVALNGICDLGDACVTGREYERLPAATRTGLVAGAALVGVTHLALAAVLRRRR